MRQRFLPGLLILAVAVGLGATVFRDQVPTAAQLLNVHVANEATDPVPVVQQGPVAVVQQGPVVQQAPEAVQLHGSFIAEADQGEQSVQLYTVPAGKRLVIEYVNFELRSAGGTVIPALETTINFTAQRWALPIQRIDNFAGNVISTGSVPTTIYGDAGTRVTARLEKANRAETIVMYVHVSGHLVNVS